MRTFKSLDEAAGYLGAMIDGEGSVALPTGTRRYSKGVNVANDDLDIVNAVLEAASMLGLTPFIGKRARANGKVGHLIWFCRWADIKRISEIVPIRSERKLAKIRRIVVEKEPPVIVRRPPKELLEQKYLIEMQSAAQIAEGLGTWQAVVRHWLREYHVPLRGRREASLLAYRTGRHVPRGPARKK